MLGKMPIVLLLEKQLIVGIIMYERLFCRFSTKLKPYYLTGISGMIDPNPCGFVVFSY